MDLTEGTTIEKQKRAKKTMMLFAMVSMVMTFAGLTSAYVVSKGRGDWLVDVQFPLAFIYSTVVVFGSSVTFYLAKKAVDANRKTQASILLWSTLVLGIVFVLLQFKGFSEIIDQGYWFTGPASNIVSTFMFVIVATHLVHLIGGLIVLIVVLINHTRNKYSNEQTLGIELGAMYWHFVDFLWLYLFLFLYFMK